MQPDDNEAGSDTPEASALPQVPRPPELPQPPVIDYHRPRLAGGNGMAESAPTGMTRDQAPGGTNDLGAAGRIGAGLSIGVTFAASILVGCGIGMTVDRHWPGFSPWGTVVFALIGTTAGFMNLYRLMTSLLPRDKRK